MWSVIILTDTKSKKVRNEYMSRGYNPTKRSGVNSSLNKSG